MYYLYKKTKSSQLPKFNYDFKKFEDFYAIAHLLEMPVVGTHYVRIQSDSYKDIINFLKVSDSYQTIVIYIEVNEVLLNYILLQKPGLSLLESKSNFEVFKELVSKYNILFKPNSIKTMYFSIGHSYAEMDEALQLVKQQFPDIQEIGDNEISQLFVVDNLIYPRNVLIAYLRMTRGRKTQLEKCINYFGNDMVLYAMRKNIRKLLDEKIKYLKTGQGSGLMKLLPISNLVQMANVLDFTRGKFMDIRTLMALYEVGGNINDTLQKRTYSFTDEEYYALR